MTTPVGSPRAVVITASTRAAAGTYPDNSGPLIAQALQSWGFAVAEPQIVADGAPVAAALTAAVDTGVDVIITSGGTGLSPTDRTPEATRALIHDEVPGIAEALRAAGVAAGVPAAMLSRGLAGVVRRDEQATLIVNLPGSSGAVRDGLRVLEPVLVHAVEQLRAVDHPASQHPQHEHAQHEHSQHEHSQRDSRSPHSDRHR